MFSLEEEVAIIVQDVIDTGDQPLSSQLEGCPC